MNAFIVDLKNKPAELAKVAEAIAQKGIDITGFSGSTFGDSGTLTLITDNEAATRRVLTDGSWKFRTIDVVETSLPEQARRACRSGPPARQGRRQHRGGVSGGNKREQRPSRVRDRQPAKAKQALGEPVGATSR